ncbi:HNH endonuclease family protein [Candidatus Rhodoluna planktonica]|uniref:GmrSD restriction endonucleases C-terminal domain-containing protein n=1 Tax=Candidatus Rhodoluna planktonica TaxID=535712 RepID=A0A1D9DYJ9_9MICO|nr:hypothetical protein A4Z71_02435 [Candidatus Rhodoluna planktonica]
MKKRSLTRTLVSVFTAIALLNSTPAIASDLLQRDTVQVVAPQERVFTQSKLASAVLQTLTVKGRAPKTGYERAKFGDGWGDAANGCDMRNEILKWDLRQEKLRAGDSCIVETGILRDPYTAKTIKFVRGVKTSSLVQIDHVVSLSDAWQKGAQQWTDTRREQFANDPLNLLAVDGPTNAQKSDSDAASWLPPNKAYRCAFIARQIAVKAKYRVWVTAAEKKAMAGIISACPKQAVPN